MSFYTEVALFVLISVVCVSHRSGDAFLVDCNKGNVNGLEMKYTTVTDEESTISCFLVYSAQSLFVSGNIVRWKLVQDSNPSAATDLGSCVVDGNCTSVYGPDVVLTIQSGWGAHLSLTSSGARMLSNGTVLCKVASPDESRQYNDSCRCNFMSWTNYSCAVQTVHKDSWTISTTCDVSHFFSSLGIYSCFLIELLNQTYNYPYYRDLYRGFHNWTSPLKGREHYIDASTGLHYYGGQCLFSLPLPTDYGNVSYYSSMFQEIITDWSFFDRHALKNRWVQIGRILIDPPQQPYHSCDEQQYIPERTSTTDKSCACSTPYLGKPEGRLLWVAEGTILAAGEYGATHLYLPIDRKYNDAVITCQLDWTKSSYVSFKARVAYGPDDVQIYPQNVRIYHETVVNFICQASNMNPAHAFSSRWGGLCDGQHGPTCTLLLRAPEDHGKEITCSVVNSLNNNHSVSSRVQLNLLHAPFSSHSSPPVDQHAIRMEGVGIGVGTVAAVVLVVVSVGVFVLCRQGRLPRCTLCNPDYETTSVHQNVQVPEHPYTDLNTYELVGSNASRGPTYENADNTRGAEVYENTKIDTE